jgi:hypothetical protein
MKSRAVVAGFLLLGLADLTLRSPARHHFTVTNESGQTVQDLVVEVGPDTRRYKHFPPSGAVSASFRFNNEATFRIKGRLADGTVFDDSAGYVVWENLVVRSRIVIGEGGEVSYSEWRFP